MNLSLIAAAVVIIITASILSTRSAIMPLEVIDKEEQSEVLSEETASPEPNGTRVPEQTESPKASTPEPTSTSSPSPANTQKPQTNTNSSDWKYPGASVVSDGNILVLTSPDSTDAITDWYKNKIENTGYNVRSSVKTSANDKVKNVISAANGQSEVSIEITKSPGDSNTKVEVDLSSI